MTEPKRSRECARETIAPKEGASVTLPAPKKEKKATPAKAGDENVKTGESDAQES